MFRYILKRLRSLLISLLVSSVVVFAVIEVVPGDTATFMLGLNADEATVTELRQQLGLDMPLYLRYLSWAGGLLQGDFGVSYTYRTPVAEMVAERVMVSLPLALYALFLTILLALPLGLLAATHHRSPADVTIMGGMQLGVALPNFWFAMLLVQLFAVKLGWFGAGGFAGWENGWVLAIKSLTLPAVALALPQASILVRVVRSSLLDTLDADFIRTARAKGLTYRQVVYRHALRNALIQVLTILGLQFSFLLAGAIIVENVFFLPGLGRLIFQSLTQRDLIVVESVVMLLVFAVIVVNFGVDLAYAAVDPRLRSKE